MNTMAKDDRKFVELETPALNKAVRALLIQHKWLQGSLDKRDIDIRIRGENCIIRIWSEPDDRTR